MTDDSPGLDSLRLDMSDGARIARLEGIIDQQDKRIKELERRCLRLRERQSKIKQRTHD